MFVTPAFAQAAGGGGLGLTNLLPLILIFVIMYFLLIRPQQKKVKEHKAMVTALKKGDKVVTQGGVIGRITKAKENENEIEVEIAPDVTVKVVRSTISQLMEKTN
ncbi:MAG: preprotein translocase subunit YajC [Paracoccaceae bacterium]|nr:preprotein translocase subunit YajC [Paracoccaceae bacterium]MCY4100125.1 preprotein translocase subunit YajC [Paracoccaceae bacterium]MDE2675876.1 preprotein translocase subunit YajC [Paracoccaceae bacterium]MXZ49702.1 preprotein translocase subunit YajC [Paracoccaceae bacterium]MYF46781.1 preprotein translocase subunit YajC [Paracoccaceae bacterium]